MNDQAQELIPVTAVLVADEHRMDFLPTYFGTRLMMRGEALTYGWMRRLAESYNGGLWNYYTLTNGGFYMAPVLGRLRLEVDGNGYSGEMSADAAGIVVTLFVLGQLAAETQGLDECDGLIDSYYWLREYAGTHAEAAQIYRAID
ncbi:antirestriction protein [Salmonella enterica subsp. enterica serovar Schwarzengrund]|nr:antirestriction protein [Salmonella enterica subsp. enterica serovar Schwarzengrund]